MTRPFSSPASLPSKTMFIVTYAGAGGLQVQSMLNKQQGVCCRGERSDSLLHLANAWQRITVSDPMQGLRKLAKPTEKTHPWFGAETIDPDTFGQQLARTFIEEALNPPQTTDLLCLRLMGVHTYGVQLRPFLKFLITCFPDARIVFLTRDPKEVATIGPWKNRPRAQVIDQLTKVAKRYDLFVQNHPDRAIRLDFSPGLSQAELLAQLT